MTQEPSWHGELCLSRYTNSWWWLSDCELKGLIPVWRFSTEMDRVRVKSTGKNGLFCPEHSGIRLQNNALEILFSMFIPQNTCIQQLINLEAFCVYLVWPTSASSMGQFFVWCFRGHCNFDMDVNTVFRLPLLIPVYRGYPAKRALSAMRKHGG